MTDGRGKAAQQVNAILVQTYWEIGKYIVEYEQRGNEKAEYGSQLFDRLSRDLTNAYGKGFSRSNLFQIRMLYIKFPIIQTLSGQLTWSHYVEILKAENELEISFYTKQAEKEKWSVRELKRQMKSMLFHRLALSTDKEGVLKLANEGHEVQQPEDLIKDPLAYTGILCRILPILAYLKTIIFVAMINTDMPNKIHEGKNIKRFREMPGMKQDALAFELGDDWNQKRYRYWKGKKQ